MVQKIIGGIKWRMKKTENTEVKEVEKPKVSTRYTRNPLRSKREVDNLYSMQVWAMEELWKALEINKNN